MLYDSLHESQLISLFYVSRSSLQESKAQEEVSNIVSFALSNNAGLSVTGALLYTGAHFAQVGGAAKRCCGSDV